MQGDWLSIVSSAAFPVVDHDILRALQIQKRYDVLVTNWADRRLTGKKNCCTKHVYWLLTRGFPSIDQLIDATAVNLRQHAIHGPEERAPS